MECGAPKVSASSYLLLVLFHLIKVHNLGCTLPDNPWATTWVLGASLGDALRGALQDIVERAIKAGRTTHTPHMGGSAGELCEARCNTRKVLALHPFAFVIPFVVDLDLVIADLLHYLGDIPVAHRVLAVDGIVGLQETRVKLAKGSNCVLRRGLFSCKWLVVRVGTGLPVSTRW